MATSLDDFVRNLPKAELHVHIEGTLEPEMMFALATRNGITLPYATLDEVREAYSFADLQSFLDVCYAGAAVLRTERDFDELMTAYLRRATADGVRRAEIFFDPQTYTNNGVGFDVFMPGFLSAIERCHSDLGIDSALIMCFLRHLPVESALDTFEAAEPYLERLLGVGLDSSELGHPPRDFELVFDRARAAGLHTVAHAGEEGPAAYVWSALDHLGVERIDHGVRAADDDALIARLVDSGVPLTMCPLSNLALGVVGRLEDHNLKAMLDRGVKVTINSDDPAYDGGYILDNYIATAQALDLSRTDLVRLASNSIEASFAPEADKAAWLAELAVVASTG